MTDKERSQIQRMFDAIAFRYDCVNRLLSLRRDVAWRKAMACALPRKPDLRILDLAAGTGDVAMTLLKKCRTIEHIIGADVSLQMLRHAQKKQGRAKVSDAVSFVQADAAALCWAGNTFDVVTVAFGVRNFTELGIGLSEIHRVLRPRGYAIILEFSMPENPLVRAAYLLYFRHILPRVGGLISRQPDAYRYLNRSVEAFPCGQDFCGLLLKAGLVSVQAQPLTCGIATLYIAQKPV